MLDDSEKKYRCRYAILQYNNTPIFPLDTSKRPAETHEAPSLLPATANPALLAAAIPDRMQFTRTVINVHRPAALGTAPGNIHVRHIPKVAVLMWTVARWPSPYRSALIFLHNGLSRCHQQPQQWCRCWGSLYRLFTHIVPISFIGSPHYCCPTLW